MGPNSPQERGKNRVIQGRLIRNAFTLKIYATGGLTFDKEPEQYLFSYLLRPGNADAKQGCFGLLKRVLPKLRQAFPSAVIRLRLDSGFSGPDLYEFMEEEKCQYVVAMAKNSVLKTLAEPAMTVVREDADQDIETICYDDDLYAARSWSHKRRVIIKGQITYHSGRQPKENPRFLITNINRSPRHIYEKIYCGRGDAENRIKELKDGLEIDRTSCSSFLANQLRVLMTAAAYVLFQELRLKARHTRFGRAQVSTIRLHLLKFGAWVESSVRRVVLHLPTSTPFSNEWVRIAQKVGTVPT